jgi:SAM-dependent methyltransferase
MTEMPPDRQSGAWPPPEDRNRVHWLVERELRQELLASSAADRAAVTRDVYNRLFEEVPWHHANVGHAGTSEDYEQIWFRLYGSVAKATDTLVDLGCGSGNLIRGFSHAVRECIGIDTSDVMIELAENARPRNARFLVGDLIEPPLPDRSADVVITRQVVEHLHPDDLPIHLESVRRILRPGGRYLVETPSRLTGPWDISRTFTPVASGFHLREYTNGELAAALRDAGFARVRAPALPSRARLGLGAMGARCHVPAQVKAGLERVLERIPPAARLQVAGLLGVREVVLVAVA